MAVTTTDAPFTADDVNAAVGKLVDNHYDRELTRADLVEIVQIVLTSAAVRGRLLPAPTEVRVEYAAWCHGEDRNGIRLDQDRFASRAQAVAWSDEQIGRYGITGYRVMRREHHIFAEDASFASASTYWVEDTEEER